MRENQKENGNRTEINQPDTFPAKQTFSFSVLGLFFFPKFAGSQGNEPPNAWHRIKRKRENSHGIAGSAINTGLSS
jgi:hypothetical protein